MIFNFIINLWQLLRYFSLQLKKITVFVIRQQSINPKSFLKLSFILQHSKIRNHTYDTEKSFKNTISKTNQIPIYVFDTVFRDPIGREAVDSSRRNMACNKISIQEIGKQSGPSGIPGSRTIVGKTHMNSDSSTNRRSYSIPL